MTKRAPARLRRIILNLAPKAALLIASMGLATLLAEATVRAVAPQQLILIRPDLWQPADTVGWLRRPGVNVKMNTGERTVSIITDEHGFRVGASGPEDEGPRVLVLGDSFMEALQVEYEESASGLLESGLQAMVGGPVAIRNAGVGGWDPDQYVLRARSLLPQDDYDLVITGVYLGNDVISRRRDYIPPRAPVERNRFHLPRGMSSEAFTNATLRPLNDFLEVRSHLFLFFRNRLQTLRMRLGLFPLDFPPQFLKSEANASRWDVTADLLAELDDIATVHGTEALFVLIPTSFQLDSVALRRYVQGFDLDPNTIDIELANRELGRRLNDRELRFIDLLPGFRAAHEQGQRLFGSVDAHFSPDGNRLFADLVTPAAAELLANRIDASEVQPSRP